MGMSAKRKQRQAKPLVVLAGGGDFPLIAAERIMDEGRPVLVVGIEGEASKEIEDFPHAWIKRGQLGALFRLMRTFGAKDILLLGTFKERRLPTWREVDVIGLWEVFRNRNLLKNGDDTVLRTVARLIEGRGFRVVAPGEVVPEMLAREGLIGRYRPTDEDLADVLAGYRAAKDLGRRDVGQAVVASGGRPVGQEDASGTDALLDRIAVQRAAAGETAPQGVLVKCMKPGQDERLDLPAIGPATVRNAARAGLAGIAVEAGRTLIVDEDILVELADRLGLFVMGVRLPEPGTDTAEAEEA